jgi:predicted TIM-barrel fold metal-dependent hydrolase
MLRLRLLYASDWPVSEQTHRYPTWVAILDDLTAGCSTIEIRNLFRGNAIDFYRFKWTRSNPMSRLQNTSKRP